MVLGCFSAYGIGNLFICEGTINNERNVQVIEAAYSAIPTTFFFKNIPAYFCKTMPIHVGHMLLQCGFVVKKVDT